MAKRYRGYAAIDRPGGSMVWGTLSMTERDAQAAYDKWNPGIKGSQIVPITIIIEKPD